MQWVETRGASIDIAVDRALDELGVDRSEAEIEILDDVKTGLFGRVKSEARVRVRVVPRAQRPKMERRDRKKKPSRDGQQREASPTDEPKTAKTANADSIAIAAGESSNSQPKPANTRVKREPQGASMSSDYIELPELSFAEQGAVVETFLAGLTNAFGYETTSEMVVEEGESVDVRVSGEGLGLLLGPKGRTLDAVQELARTVVQRKSTAVRHSRIRVDIGQYHERRRAALSAFAVKVAESVASSGVVRELEPMNSPDRKIVHDAIMEVEGVASISEGEEPRRRVVIQPRELA